MIGNTELGPGCPVCSSGEWSFSDPSAFTVENSNRPAERVTVRAGCHECDTKFDLDLRLDDDAFFREVKPKTVAPPVGFGWGSEISQGNAVLHIWGALVDTSGSDYVEEYHLENMVVVEDNP